MNILVLTAYPPVLQMHGGGVRMFHNIRILAEKHRVRVISFFENEREREMLRTLDGICESVTAVQRVPDFRPHWLSLKPFLVREFSTPEMYRAVESAFRARAIDVLQCEYLPMAQFRRSGVFTILTVHETQAPGIYDAFRKERDPIARCRLFYRWMSILRYEVLQSRKFDRVVTMTEYDAEYLREYSPAANIRAIPIGVDTDEFTPLPEASGSNLQVVFLGNFRHSPNVEAAGFLMNKVAPMFPEIRFVISGANFPGEPGSGPNVECTGYLADTRVLYRRPNTIVAAPLFSGTGQRVKLLEAFAMGCPVITSRTGALGFPVSDGVDAMFADTVQDFEVALRRLIASEELRRRLGANAREMILRHFSWSKIGQELLGVVEEAASVSGGIS